MTPQEQLFLEQFQAQQKRRHIGGSGPGTTYGGTGPLQENLMTVPPDFGPLDMTALRGRSDTGLPKRPSYVENRGEVEMNPTAYPKRTQEELARLFAREKAAEEKAPKAWAANLAARDKSYAEEGGLSPEDIAATPQPNAPAMAPPVAEPSASNAGAPEPVLPPGSNVPADDPKGQFLRAIALKGQASGSDNRKRDFMQALQSADENMQLPPSLISAWSPQGMHFLESSPGGPSKTRQKAIDEINVSDRASEKNAADIEAARVKNESAAQSLRPLQAGQVDATTSLQEAEATMEKLLAGLPGNENAVGPWDARLGKVMEFFGGDAKGAEYRRQIQSALNDYVQKISGAGVPVAEFPRLIKGYLSPQEHEKVFKEKAEGILEDIRTAKARHFKGLEAANFDTSSFDKGSGGMVKVDLGGRIGQIPAAQLDAFMAKNPTAKKL